MKSLSLRGTQTLGLLIGALALAACDTPAGSELDRTGGFGNATVNNMVAQTCKSSGGAGGGKIGGSGKAGSTLGDPVVVLDPASTPSEPIFRVFCDGDLDGKYAAVIYRDYVNSAGQAQTVAAASTQ